MKTYSRLAMLAAAMTISGGMMAAVGSSDVRAQAANPCAPKAANPCAPKAANPCAPKAANPCAGKPGLDSKLFLRPKGTNLAGGNRAQLVKQGEALFKSTKLSTNDMSCQSCHANNENFAATFSKPYPHEVAMAKEQGGVAKIKLDEMIQLCMVVPMASKPLRWDSQELSALTAYTGELQTAFRKQASSPKAKSANPCAPAAKKAANPCAANPCAQKKK